MFLNDTQVNLDHKLAKDNSAEYIISHFTGECYVTFKYQHYR